MAVTGEGKRVISTQLHDSVHAQLIEHCRTRGVKINAFIEKAVKGQLIKESK